MHLKEKMQGIVPKEHLKLLSNRIHIIGNVAILSLPAELDDYKRDVASAVFSLNKNVRTIINKTSRLEGEKRVAEYEHLAGEGTVTMHREFGFIYRLDVTRVFFNSHLGYERIRVASQVKPGEKVIVPFAGVGPFVMPLAARGARVVALEKNREACSWLAENAKINGLYEKVDVINADAFYMLQNINTDFDRAVIPTPYGMDQILGVVLPKVNAGGIIHFYTFKKRNELETQTNKYVDMGLEVICSRECGNVAPGVCRWAFDLRKPASF